MSKQIKFIYDPENRTGLYQTEDNLLVTFKDGKIVEIVRNPYKDQKFPFVAIKAPQVGTTEGSDV